jgi:hypothetical protein
MQGRIEFGRAVQLFHTLILAVLVSACTGGGESTTELDPVANTPETEFDHELTGSVGDGPVVGATMRVMANDGSTIAELQSDSNAGYNITVRTKGKFYPLTIDARSGTDLVTNLPPDFDLYGAVLEPKKKSIANLSPFSTIAVALAQHMSGEVISSNLKTAESIVARELNSGLDTLAMQGMMWTNIDASNLAEIVKASETLGETIRRVRDFQIGAGRTSSGNVVVQSIAADLVDEVIDGDGGPGVNARVAALTTVVSAQTLLESMQNELHVSGQVATAAMESAMNDVSSTGSAKSFEELALTADMLSAAQVGLDAGLAVASTPDLQALHDAVDTIQAGMVPATVRPVIPDSYRATLDQLITTVANGTDAQISTVNSISRGEVDIGTGSVTLSWTAPTENEDGSVLTDLAGFNLYWGTTPGSYSNSVRIADPNIATYTVDGLAPGTYEFVGTSFNAAGVESVYSNPTTKTVP